MIKLFKPPAPPLLSQRQITAKVAPHLTLHPRQLLVRRLIHRVGWTLKTTAMNCWLSLELAAARLKVIPAWFLAVAAQLKTVAQQVKTTLTNAVMLSEKGKLSWYSLFILASRNLLRSFSRTGVTIVAIASGTAAIVFLVGFAYGLQAIVTDRLIQPNSLRLADIQSSSTALVLNRETLGAIEQLDGVKEVAPAMSLAGSLKFDQSKTEVVVIGARNTFLDYSHLEIVAGTTFTEVAEAIYEGQPSQLTELLRLTETGQVAGAAIEQVEIIKPGDPTSTGETYFRIADEVYVPLRTTPSTGATIVGYVRGSILERYQGNEVWGGTYESVNAAGKAHQDSTGEWFGRWLEVAAVPIYQESAPTVYTPVTDGSSRQLTSAGYIAEARVLLLSQEDVRADQLLEQLMEESGSVLGEATESGEVSNLTDSDSVDNATNSASLSDSALAVVLTSSPGAQLNELDEAAVLKNILEQEQEIEAASRSAQQALVSIPRQGGKEIIVSTGLLNVWQLKPEEVIGKTMSLELIISGGLIPNLSGRVVTTPVDYQILGVFRDDSRSMVYAPLSDVESLGIEKYTLAKVLSSDNATLKPVREKIEALGFMTRSIADTLSQVERLFGIMRFLLGSFGMIAFIVALFGMFNTLTVSLLERTREIGVMKTLGTTNADVMRLMVVEAALIGVVGGILGIILGMLIGSGVDLLLQLFRTDSGQGGLFRFPLGFLLLVFGLAVVVGMATGLYPAQRAKRISALNALRYE